VTARLNQRKKIVAARKAKNRLQATSLEMASVDDPLPPMDVELLSFVLYAVQFFHVFYYSQYKDRASLWKVWDNFMRSLEVFEHLVGTAQFADRPRAEVFVLSFQVIYARHFRREWTGRSTPMRAPASRPRPRRARARRC